jgi:hypothetical protein
MDAADLSIIEEWLAGCDDLIPMDRMHFKGLELETLLARRSRFGQDWLAFMRMVRTTVYTQDDKNEEM